MRDLFLAKAVATIKLLVSLFRVARPAGFTLGLPGGGKSGERWHRTVRTQTASAVEEEILQSVVMIGWMRCIKTPEVNTPLELIHSQFNDPPESSEDFFFTADPKQTWLNEPKKIFDY